MPVIMKEENGQTPRFFTRCLVELEDFINEMWEDKVGRKNMSKNNRQVKKKRGFKFLCRGVF